jgi:TaqI-like C-terminal specificity domain
VFRGQNLTLDQLIKPFLIGDNVEKWSPEPPDQFIIRIEKGWTRMQVQTDDESIAWNWFANRFPQVAPRFLLHKDKAMARSDQGDFWWELRACEYYSEFDRPKICIPEMSQGPKFARDVSGCTLNNKVFFLPYSPELIGYMNSRLAWFYLFGRCAQLRGGKWRLELREQYISTLPIPAKGLGHDPSLAFRSSLAVDAAGSRTQRISTFLRRIPDLCPSDRRPKLTERLKEWWKLDFKSFRAEINKAFKADIPLKQRGEWENFRREEGEKVRRLTAEIEQAEREIDAIVYKLFDLTPDEIALLESSLAGQY